MKLKRKDGKMSVTDLHKKVEDPLSSSFSVNLSIIYEENYHTFLSFIYEVCFSLQLGTFA